MEEGAAKGWSFSAAQGVEGSRVDLFPCMSRTHLQKDAAEANA